MVHAGLTAGVVAVLLTASAATASKPDPKPRKPRDPAALRCRTETVTGSLIQTRKICLTDSQWSQLRDDTERLQSTHICTAARGCSGG